MTDSRSRPRSPRRAPWSAAPSLPVPVLEYIDSGAGAGPTCRATTGATCGATTGPTCGATTGSACGATAGSAATARPTATTGAAVAGSAAAT
eukprot:5211796-Alexandrium_andersonii.AAC.1